MYLHNHCNVAQRLKLKAGEALANRLLTWGLCERRILWGCRAYIANTRLWGRANSQLNGGRLGQEGEASTK